MKRTALLFLLLISSLAFGQGVAVPPQVALKTVNGITSPLANATITVCPANAIGLPCTPATISLFKDTGLTQPLSNPFPADSNGNYNFVLNAAAISGSTLTVTVTGSGYSGYSYPITIPLTGTTNQNFSGNLTFSGNNTHSGTETFSGPTTISNGLSATFANPGVFTNSQGNYYLQSLINGLSPASEYHIINANSGLNTTDGISGGVAVPVGAGVFQANAVAGYINCSTITTNCVGGYFQARPLVNGHLSVWGINPVVSDIGFTGSSLAGIEVDTNATSTTTTVQGIQLNGSFTAQPTTAIGINAVQLQGTGHWLAILVSANGASNDIFAQIGANGTINNSNSQRLGFVGIDSGGIGREGFIGGSPTGSLQFTPPTGQGVGVQAGSSALVPRGLAEFSTQGVCPDALNVNLANNVNITDGSNTGMSMGFCDTGALRGFIQARNNVGANNTAYPLQLEPLGGDVNIGGMSGTSGGGIAPDGGGMKHKRVAGCATAASLAAVCTTTFTWTTAFADTNYSVSCTGDVISTGVPLNGGLTSKTAAAVIFQTVSGTAVSAQYTTIDCVAVHD